MKLQKFTINILRTQINMLSLVSKKKAGEKAFDIFCTPYGKKVYTPDHFFESAQTLEIKFEGQKTIGYRWNKGGNKKILIAHGFKSCSFNFSHFIKEFITKGYEVVAFDAPAHGRSEGKRLTALIYKRFIQKIIETYGPFDAFLAHSFGAMGVCFALAEANNSNEIKIVLVAPASNTLSLSKMFFEQMKIKDERIQHYFLKKIEHLGKHPLEWFTLKRCLNTLQSKILWIHDNDDKITPVKDAIELQKLNYGNIRFIFTNGLGHQKIYRDERVINTILEFL